MTLTFVGSSGGGSNNSPGPVSLTYSNTQGNMLVVAAGWNVAAPTNQFSGGGPIVPCAAVADDAGNRWRLIADSGSTVSGARCAIWICLNALPIRSWLSICPQGNYISLGYVVSEFSGLPSSYWPVIDVSLNTAAWNVTSLSLSPIASQADYLLSVGATGDTTVTVTPPGGSWNLAGSASVGGSSPDGIQVSSSYQAVAAGTTTATSYSVSAARSLAMCVIGISQQNFIPAQQKEDFPLVVTEAALGSTIGDPSVALLDSSWTDISQYAIGSDGSAVISATRGRQYELSQPESGTLHVTCNNLNGVFNPQNAGSPFYSNALNANMSFQSGISHWSGQNGATVASSTAFSYKTAAAAIVTSSLVMNGDGVTSTPGAISESVTVNLNYKYTASAWILCPGGYSTGGGCSAAITWKTAGGAVISTSSGTPVVIPAGVFTQVTVTATPPATTATGTIVIQAQGVPTAGTLFYVAEAAIVQGSSVVSTGLVRLGTPVRVTAFWNGRNYPVAWGLVERWPQGWPSFTQWGWSDLIATDIAGAANVSLPSALQGQMLADQPYACFPFSEQYSSSSNTLNGVVRTTSECDGQIATNTVITNQRPAVYIDGNRAVETGLSMGFLGDNGTGIGVTGYTTFDLSGDRGPGVQYGPDLTLPSLVASGNGNLTLEVWTTIPNSVTLPASAVSVQLWEVLIEPDLASNGANNLAQGCLITGGIYYSTTQIQPYWQPNWVNTIYVGSAVATGELCQIGFVLENGNLYTLENGALSGAITGATVAANLYALAFGLSTSVTGSRGISDGNFNYSVALAALYPYKLSSNQLVNHWNAGSSGFTGDSVIQRAGRYVSWAQVNVGLAGVFPTNGIAGTPPLETPLLGPAYSSAGGQLNAALTADSVSTGSRWGAVASGNLVVTPRTVTYNKPSFVTFGNSPTGFLNANSQMNAGTVNWTSNGNATLAGMLSPDGFGGYSIQVTPDGVTASPGIIAGNGVSTHIPVTVGVKYLLGAWALSSAGWASGGTVSLTWFTSGNVAINSAISGTAQLSVAGAWTYMELAATAPATASYMIAKFTATGTPSSSSLFYISSFTIQVAADQVTYAPRMALDYDNTYVQNSAEATLTNGPNTLASPLVVDSASVVKYLQRGPLAQQVSGQTTEDAYDRATWSLGKYGEPSLRVSGMTVDGASQPQSFYNILQTDIGTYATVNRNPIGTQGYTLPVVVEQVTLSIGPGHWEVSYQQSPYAPENSVLYVDSNASATDNILGNSALPW